MPYFYLIGAAAEQAGLSPQTVREYCRKGLIQPIRDSAGRRLFTSQDVTSIRDIFLGNASRRSLCRA